MRTTTRRRHGLLSVLARTGWAPRRKAWTVPCRDRAGRRFRAQVLIAEHGPALAIGSRVAVLDPLAGRHAADALARAPMLLCPEEDEDEPTGRHAYRPSPESADVTMGTAIADRSDPGVVVTWRQTAPERRAS